MFTPEAFRKAFPQFTEELFPDSRLTFWLKIAEKSLDKSRWADFYEEGILLFTAHNLTLEKASMVNNSQGTGGIEASLGGYISESKTIGSISISKNKAGNTTATLGSNIFAGHYNDTVYGKQYWGLVQLVGIGGLHV